MKKLMVLLVAMAFAAGSAYGIDYVWKGATGNLWTDISKWDNGSGASRDYPRFATDTVLITNGTGPTLPNSTITIGNIVMFGGTGAGVYQNGGGLSVLALDNSAGSGGNYHQRGTAVYSYYTAMTWDVQGNYYNPDGHIQGKYANPIIRMKGNNTAIYYSDSGWPRVEIHGQGVWDNGMGPASSSNSTITVKSGGTIGNNPNARAGQPSYNGTWSARRFIFEDGQANLPAIGGNCDFAYAPNSNDSYGVRDNGLVGRCVVTGGITYPGDVFIRQGGTVSRRLLTTSPYTWRVKGGDFTVGRDFSVGIYQGGSVVSTNVFDTLENGTSTSVNITVKRDFWVNPQGYYDGQQFLARLNSSIIRVGRDLRVTKGANDNGALDMGDATIYVGRDFNVYRPRDVWVVNNWNAGGSTVICDGNGTTSGITQTLNTWGDCGIALHDLVIRTGAGDCVTLAAANYAGTGEGGNLLLTGDLRLEKGKFIQNKKKITFNGPDHHIYWDNVNLVMAGVSGSNLDCIVLAPGAVLYLDSFINTDNVDLKADSKLYLNGFTLLADGKRWVSGEIDGTTGVSWDSGTIYGTLAIPEPATLLLLGTGALGAVGWLRRRRMS